MTGLPSVEPAPVLEALFRSSAEMLGPDLAAYRNHAHRVFQFARALGAQGAEVEHKLAIACHFHDLGIWTHDTFDYLAPSVALARAHLDEQGLSGWQAEISSMIREHHRITSAGDTGSLVDIFRRADWIDVSVGLRSFTVPRTFVREVRRVFPNCGFHRRLVALTFERIRTNPLSPLPMFHW